jgi:hypothetical protein
MQSVLFTKLWIYLRKLTVVETTTERQTRYENIVTITIVTSTPKTLEEK